MKQHLLFMPDGNRRYAKKESINLSKAYDKGAQTLELFVNFFLIKNNWSELTMHFMSKYTHNRDDGSLEPIYSALTKMLQNLDNKHFFTNNNLKLISIDHSGRLPQSLQEITYKIEKETKNNKKIVRILLGYDLDTDEKQAFEKSKSYEEFIKNRLIPNIDLVIRTTEMRASKGPVYAMSQAQMLLLNKLNPELKEQDLMQLLQEYKRFVDYRKTTNPTHNE